MGTIGNEALLSGSVLQGYVLSIFVLESVPSLHDPEGIRVGVAEGAVAQLVAVAVATVGIKRVDVRVGQSHAWCVHGSGMSPG